MVFYFAKVFIPTVQNIRERRVWRYGRRNRKVVQRKEGLWVY